MFVEYVNEWISELLFGGLAMFLCEGEKKPEHMS